MATRIRLARGGAKKRPFYRIVVADARSPRDGKFIEKVGIYHPMLEKTNPERVRLNEERIRYWLGQGASPSERVEGFLIAANLFARNKTRQKLIDQRIEKTQEEKKQKEAAAAAEVAAKAKADAEAKAEADAKAKEEAAATAASAAAEPAADAEAASA